jgi:hypothetical protein
MGGSGEWWNIYEGRIAENSEKNIIHSWLVD